MIVDSSVVIAILEGEPEAAGFASVLATNETRISAANWLEAAMVADSRGAGDAFDELIAAAEVSVEPVTADHARSARAAFRRYGKGSGSPAKLNLGDCFAYALSAVSGEPLLFKGDDFPHTDVLRARS